MKERTYMIEDQFLSQYATKSLQTKGRAVYEQQCMYRTDFQRDRDRIIHSKAFRRLKNKTQVFLAPTGDHYRTRLTHTLDVAQIARSVSRALSLNEDLTEAIALGHDLGHTPFGHTGENTLSRLTNGYFQHNEQSVRVVQVLENDGKGLNLTAEVLDGIQNHRSRCQPFTLEGAVVRLADKIAYISHDIDDAVRANIICAGDIPKEYTDILGNTATSRINSLITSVCKTSLDKNAILLEPCMQKALEGVREYLFNHVYTSDGGNRDSDKADILIESLFNYYSQNENQLPANYVQLLEKYPKEVVLCDYIASMSDTYAIDRFNELFIPRRWTAL